MSAFVVLALLVFTIPWEKSVIIPGVGTITKLLGVAVAVLALPKWREFKLNAVSVALAVFIGWSAYTWFWSLDRSATEARLVTYLQLLVLFLLVSHEKKTRILAASYAAGAAVASVATVTRYLLGMQTYWRRYAAPGFDPNDLGVTVAIAIPLALYATPPWVGRGLVALYSAAILLTASRTALIAAVTALILTALFWRGQRLAGAVLACGLLSGALSFGPKAARERIATTTTEISRGTLHQRTTIWKAGLKAWRSQPLLGSGAGAYPDAVEPLIGRPGRPGHEYVAHSVFLSVLVETGLIGAMLLGAVMLLIGLFTWVLPAQPRVAFSIAFVVWLAGAATLTWEHRKPTWLLPAFVCSLWTRSFRDETG